MPSFRNARSRFLSGKPRRWGPAAVPCLPFLLSLPFLLPLAALPGCAPDTPADLKLADLTPAERRYVTRLVVLERAKAVALVDRPRGDALLDSLAVAWGDSARRETETGIPAAPLRASQVAVLLTRVLEAELDSLLAAPEARRLAAPLPEPAPPQTAPDAAPDPSEG